MTRMTRRQALLAAASLPWLIRAARPGLANELGDNWPDSPFLTENFAPIHEEISADNLKVVGKLPDELDGMFLRNGPNPRFPPISGYHWFDGDGMLHGVRIRDGKASYRNRYVRTEGWKVEDQAGRAMWPSLMEPPEVKETLEKLLQGQLPFKNTANTAVIWHHGKTLALWELGNPYEIRLPNLETVGPYSFGKTLSHNLTAHPKIDARTGEMMAIGYWPMPPFVHYSVVNAEGHVVHTTAIEVPRPVMMHDLAITAQYSIFFDLPAMLNPIHAIQGKPVIDFNPDYGTRIGVLPRHANGNKIRWFEIETCFMFHVLNAFERGDEIIVVGCRMPQYPKIGVGTDVRARAFHEIFHGNTKPVLYRWTLNLANSRVSEQVVFDDTVEFPRINDALAGAVTQYGYTVSGSETTTSILKSDLTSDKTVRHSLGDGRYTGEAIFVPRRDPKLEDDGWILSCVFDQAEKNSELIVVDARDFTDRPVARIKIPQRVPYGFHSTWVPGEHLS